MTFLHSHVLNAHFVPFPFLNFVTNSVSIPVHQHGLAYYIVSILVFFNKVVFLMFVVIVSNLY